MHNKNNDNQQTKETAVYKCPMHPEETSDKPGSCSKCNMDLVKSDDGQDSHSEHNCCSPSSE